MRRCAYAAALLLALLPLTFVQAAPLVTMGSRGEQVVLIQQALRQWGYYTGDVDGHFGRGTYQAVLAFQRRNGLRADGRVGSGTHERFIIDNERFMKKVEAKMK